MGREEARYVRGRGRGISGWSVGGLTCQAPVPPGEAKRRWGEREIILNSGIEKERFEEVGDIARGVCAINVERLQWMTMCLKGG